MNANLPADDPVIGFYDSDYPSPTHNPCPANFDAVTIYQGVHDDIARYLEIANENGDPVLELCCGTGRIALPLASDGHSVTGVDVSTGMLGRFKANFSNWPDDLSRRVQLVHQDICELDLEFKDYALCIIGFNSLMCVVDFEAQRSALRRAALHLRPGGQIVVDVVNPLQLALNGAPLPKPFFTRTNTDTGRTYTRFAMSDPMASDQTQRLHGWYDEIQPDGYVKRTAYSMKWRPIFRFELELMLESAGFEPVSIEGGHKKEPYRADSPHLFCRAVKRR